MHPPPWLQIAEKELGVSEIKGRDHNKRIIEYHAATSLNASEDEVPWCSSFVNWVMKQCGLMRTKSASARSWLTYGTFMPLTHPAFGSIVILKRGNNPVQGHVGFYVGDSDSDHIRVLGGNQSDKVSIANFPKTQVLAYRWPVS